MKLAYIITGVLCLAAPILAGHFIGHISLGLVIALGGLALINEIYESAGTRQIIVNLMYAVVFSIAAFMIGMAIAGTSLFSLIALPLVVLVVSTFGEINKLFIKNASRFTVFLIIGYHFEAVGKIYFLLSFNFFIGTLWTSFVLLIIKILSKNKDASPEKKTYTAGQYLNRWRRSLSHLYGWQFPLRITLCLMIAQFVRYFVPDHHSYWILLTIALVTQHNIDNQIRRIINRGLGTLIGVCISFALVYFTMPIYILIIVVGLLAFLRIVFRETNYLLYAVVMTPLVIILLDFGKMSSVSILIDRLAATIIGCVISFIFSFLIWHKYITDQTAKALRPRAQERPAPH